MPRSTSPQPCPTLGGRAVRTWRGWVRLLVVCRKEAGLFFSMAWTRPTGLPDTDQLPTLQHARCRTTFRRRYAATRRPVTTTRAPVVTIRPPNAATRRRVSHPTTNRRHPMAGCNNPTSKRRRWARAGDHETAHRRNRTAEQDAPTPQHGFAACKSVLQGGEGEKRGVTRDELLSAW